MLHVEGGLVPVSSPAMSYSSDDINWPNFKSASGKFKLCLGILAYNSCWIHSPLGTLWTLHLFDHLLPWRSKESTLVLGGVLNPRLHSTLLGNKIINWSKNQTDMERQSSVDRKAEVSLSKASRHRNSNGFSMHCSLITKHKIAASLNFITTLGTRLALWVSMGKYLALWETRVHILAVGP